MPRDGSGNYSLPAGNPVVTGTTIEAAWANSTMPDIGSEITASLPRNGVAPMTGTLKALPGLVATPGYTFDGFPSTGFFRGASHPSISRVGVLVAEFRDTGIVDFSGKKLGYTQEQWCGTATGTADALLLTSPEPISANASGLSYVFKAASTNTGAATVKVDAAAIVAIQNSGAALNGQCIVANRWYRITYTGAAYQLEELMKYEVTPFSYTGNQTLTAATHANKLVIISSGDSVVTVPLTTTMLVGYKITVKNLGTGSVTIARQGADVFDGVLTSFRIPALETVEIMAVAANNYYITRYPRNAVGDIIMGAVDVAPPGFIASDSTILVTTVYAGLFAVIGTTYNVGGEAGNQFRTPWMQGRSPIGIGQGNTAEGGGAGTNWAIGTRNGAETHTLTTPQIPAHTHSVTQNVLDATLGAGGQAGNNTGTTTGSTGGGGSHNNLHPVLALRFWIKY